MLKKTYLVTLFICCLLFAVGCGNSEPGPGDEGTITIEVANNTEDVVISYVLFYGTGLDDWGEDLLGDEVIEPGEIFNFVMPEGNYTLIPMTFDPYVIPGARNINSDTKIEIGGNGLVPVLVINNTQVDIFFLYSLLRTEQDVIDDLMDIGIQVDADVLEEKALEMGLITSEDEMNQQIKSMVIVDILSQPDVFEAYFEGLDFVEEGEDILGDEVLPAGLGKIFFIEPGIYDFLGLDHEGEIALLDIQIVVEGNATIVIE